MIRKYYLSFVLSIFLCCVDSYSSAAGYKDDDITWLVLDKKYGYHFLLKVQSETYMTGRARIIGGKPYLRTRFDGGWGFSKVSFLEGGFQLATDGDDLKGTFNADRSQITGNFISDKGGDFTATMLGHVRDPFSLFHICEKGSDDEPFQCSDIGRGEHCEAIHKKLWKSYTTRDQCVSALMGKKPPESREKSEESKEPPVFNASEARGWDMSSCNPILPSSNKTGTRISARFINDFLEPIHIISIRRDGSLRKIGTYGVGKSFSINGKVGQSVAFFTSESKECVLQGRLEDSDGTQIQNLRTIVKSRTDSSCSTSFRSFSIVHFSPVESASSAFDLNACLSGVEKRVDKSRLSALFNRVEKDARRIRMVNDQLNRKASCRTSDLGLSNSSYKAAQLSLRTNQMRQMIRNLIANNGNLVKGDFQKYEKWVRSAYEDFPDLQLALQRNSSLQDCPL